MHSNVEEIDDGSHSLHQLNKSNVNAYITLMVLTRGLGLWRQVCRHWISRRMCNAVTRIRTNQCLQLLAGGA